MHFFEAEQEYRELEDKLVRGELKEEEFLSQVAQLRLVDNEGRRWMLSARSGRWLLHDGQQWVFAEPPKKEGEARETPTPSAEVPAPAPESKPVAVRSRPEMPRWLVVGLAVLLLLGCLAGGGAAVWVFVLRDAGEITPTAVAMTDVSLVATFTPWPDTPTYTPTLTPTPSRTSTPTDTPIATNTPLPTDTPLPTPTPTPLPPTPVRSPTVATPRATMVAAATPTSTATPTPPSLQTYTVKPGETLSEIAVRFGVTVEALAEANDIANPALIRAGQVLIIPIPGVTSLPPTRTPTPTWTPIVPRTPTSSATTTTEATPSPTATTSTATPSPTPTTSGPTPTPRPTNTPNPTAIPTPKPAALSGKIAFTVWNPYLGAGKYELYVSNIDGTGRNPLGEGFRQPQFRQDGNLLAANGDGAPNFEHLVIMNASGGDRREVSNYSEDSYPSWSPDGAILAYSSTSWEDVSRLGIVHDLYGMQQDWIMVGGTEIRGKYPFWMGDGRVVYQGCDFLNDHAACGLYWVGAGGGNYRRLTTHQSDTAPAGSQGRVAFMSTRDGNWEIYVIDMDSGNLRRLTNNSAQDGLPTWSPDGKSIAFVSNRSGAWAIWVMDASGGNQRKLFDLGGGYGSGENDWTTERISWAP
jgi:LysM repeat protein